MPKYKVINMIGEDDTTGEKYRFSFPSSQIWDCQTAYGTAWKEGNHDVKIMQLVDGQWIEHVSATEYARKRFKLDASSYDTALYESVKECMTCLSDFAKGVKKDAISHEDIKKSMEKISELYNLLEEKLPDE